MKPHTPMDAPKTPDRTALCDFIKFMARTSTTDTTKLLDTLPNPDKDVRYTSVLRSYERRHEELQQKLTKAELGLECGPSELENLRQKHVREQAEILKNISELQETVNRNKRKFVQDEKSHMDSFKQAGVEKKDLETTMKLHRTGHRTKLRRVKAQHYGEFFKTLSTSFIQMVPDECPGTEEVERNIGIFPLGTWNEHGSNIPPLPDTEEEDREGKEESDELLDAGKVQICASTREPEEEEEEVRSTVAQKGPYRGPYPDKVGEITDDQMKTGMKKPRKTYSLGKSPSSYTQREEDKAPPVPKVPFALSGLVRNISKAHSNMTGICRPVLKTHKEKIPPNMIRSADGTYRKRDKFDSSSTTSSEEQYDEKTTSVSSDSFSDEGHYSLNGTYTRLNTDHMTGKTLSSSPHSKKFVRDLGNLLENSTSARKTASRKKRTSAQKASKKPSKPRSKLGEEKNKRHLTSAEKKNIGNWTGLAPYNHCILLDGMTCLWCNGKVYRKPDPELLIRYDGGPDGTVVSWIPTRKNTSKELWLWGTVRSRPCNCTCFRGHTREECYHDPVNRHDDGFFPSSEINETFSALRTPPVDPDTLGDPDQMMTIKTNDFKVHRDAVRRHHKNLGESIPLNTALRMTLIITYSKRNNNFKKHVMLCPLCGFVDTRGDRSYSVCRYCYGSGYIKANWHSWRDQVLIREKKIADGETDAHSVQTFKRCMEEAKQMARERIVSRDARRAKRQLEKQAK